MSLLSRNELSIVLGPHQIELLHTERKLTLLGFKSYVRANESFTCNASKENGMTWQSAVNTLENTLTAFAKHKMKVNVTLSNHFMNYMLVPWFDNMSDEDDVVFARQSFIEVYGKAAESWSVRISPCGVGIASLACSVDSKLLDELRGLFGQMGFVIQSIQPQLMEAINSCRTSLKGRDAWLAILEPEVLCLALLKKGRLVWIRKLHIGDDWQKELPIILEREEFIADAEIVLEKVYLWTPYLENTDVSYLGRWHIQYLNPTSNVSYSRNAMPSLFDDGIVNEPALS